jgi:phosphoenolpyruvate carboxylase
VHHERQGHLQEGSLAMASSACTAPTTAPADVAQMLQRAYISPVLTAHPTEVQRKSILDAERAIAELVGERDELHTERERRDNEALIRARVTQLWQTRMLRYRKLTVADEIENALSYYPSTFLREIPRLYRELEVRCPATRWRPSCAWATGSAATATATPTSPPPRCATHWRARRSGAALLPDRAARTRRRAVDVAARWRR